MSTTPTTNQVADASPGWLRAPLSHSGRCGKNRTSTTLSIIVPAYNEQYLIEASLQALAVLDESPRLQRITVIVVDDCSTDGTAEAIRRFQAQLESSQDFKKFNWVWLRHEKNMGKGAAIRSALAHVDTHLVVIHDADLEYHPRDLLQMLDLFLYEDADAVFGSRFMPGGYKRALFFRHALGNKLLTLIVRSRLRSESHGHGNLLQNDARGFAQEHSAARLDLRRRARAGHQAGQTRQPHF